MYSIVPQCSIIHTNIRILVTQLHSYETSKRTHSQNSSGRNLSDLTFETSLRCPTASPITFATPYKIEPGVVARFLENLGNAEPLSCNVLLTIN